MWILLLPPPKVLNRISRCVQYVVCFDRGPYTGGIFYLCTVGLAESENLICEFTVRRKCSEGGGVVFLSQLEAEFLEEIQTKVLRVFLLAIQRQLYSFALRLIFL
jgi:hypothetical protein